MKNRNAILFQFAIGICLCTGAGMSMAQENDSAPDEIAMAEFQKGIELFEAGRFIEAADRFRAAMAEKMSWKMYYNIGQSEAAAHRYGLSLEAFESYLVSGGDDVSLETKDEVLKEIERLRLLVGVIELSAPQRCELFIDGYSRGVTPFDGAIRVAAGSHQIQVNCDGKKAYDKTVKIAGGMATEIDIAGEEQDGDAVEESNRNPQSVAVSTDSPRKMPKKLLAGIITGAAGVAVTGLGVVFLIKGSADASEAEKWNLSSDRQKIDDYNDNTLPLNRAMTITGLLVGGAAMATGTVLIVLGMRERKAIRTSFVPSPGGLTISF